MMFREQLLPVVTGLLAETTAALPKLPVSPKLLLPLLGMLGLMLLFWLTGKVPVSYNIRNLMVRWKTAIMTALAFVLVVSLMTVMLAFVTGMVRLTEQSGQPGNVIVLSDGATDESFSNLGFSDTGDIERQPGVLRNDDGVPLCSKEVYAVVNQPIESPEPGRPKRRFVQVRGMDDPEMAGTVHGIALQDGKWFSQGGVEQGPESGQTGRAFIQAVLGRGLAMELGNDRPAKKPLQPGDTFELGDRTWKVVGVLDSAGSTFDSEIWAKRSLIGPMFGKETYSSLVLRTANAANASKLASYLANSYKKASLNAIPETQYFEKMGKTSQQFLVAIIFVAAVMALGGIFGVMNTMFAAISQRAKDIGVLRIMGFSRLQVLMSFLLESMVLALLGGLVGCAIGLLADGWTAKSIISSGPGGGKFVVLELVVSADVLATGMLLSLGMGALGGLVPAISAMRLRPLESLRS